MILYQKRLADDIWYVMIKNMLVISIDLPQQEYAMHLSTQMSVGMWAKTRPIYFEYCFVYCSVNVLLQ